MSILATRRDPLRAYNFIVTFVDASSQLSVTLRSIGSSAAAGFSECSGLDMTLETAEWKEGGNNGTVLKFPTRTSYSPIRLKRGVTFDQSLWDWYYSFVRGEGQRRDGLIVLQDDDRKPVKIWQFRRGLPTKFTGPTLNASQNQVAIEELEITHEGLELASKRPQVLNLVF
ncbi:MAG: phage tail protein [Chloroflexi bacterium]|jgi:phage tail-like protein|nr:phage tail protein [Chloroflexota bacterium]MBK6711059.1 phage tail protein [Chloroflexota bacterium]MBK7177992.1 phage tail protein [Chloroflexota bacterium]MBK7916066.1 phage tail protein [Chloroflexota bacterium]MBK8930951.1 phage tail protein [Chloroflexota bacterium]